MWKQCGFRFAQNLPFPGVLCQHEYDHHPDRNCRNQWFPEPSDAPAPHKSYVVVVALGNRRLGVVVDHLVGQQDIVIKSLGRSLAGVRGFAGATELGDQRVGLVLDAAAIVDEMLLGSDVTVREKRMLHG